MKTLPGQLDEPVDPFLLEDQEPLFPWRPSEWSSRTRWWVEKGVDAAVVTIVVLFILAQLGPRNLLLNTTPAGGDMGGHVWGPAYLRDHLLPSFRLTGWTPDWYAGFPAYQFYMVVPALMIVVLNAGLHGWAAIIPLAIAAYLAGEALSAPARSRSRHLFAGGAVVLVVFGVGLPYGVAFKLITVLGLLALPVCAYAMGRLAGLPFPAPALLSVSTLVFLFNREPSGGGTGNIIGGNITSTLAGEFSFSIALAFALLFIGLVIHGLRTGKRRWQAAIVLALVLTCHLIVGLFALAAAVAAYLVWPGRKRLGVVVPALAAGGLLSCFWTVPFVLRGAFVNDMGWEKSPSSAIGKPWTAMLTDDTVRNQVFGEFLAPKSLYWILALALVGLVVSIVLQIRFGWFLAITALLMAVGFIICPEARLWNARILPFYYLCLCLLAAVGVAELFRAIALLVARNPARPVFGITLAAPVAALVAVLIIVGLPLNVIPGERVTGDGFALGPFALTTTAHPARDWARWNYTGYEEKPAYAEYHGFISTFAQVGRDHGCGMAMWEYEDTRLNSYGTPMAPMLLPYWTDGCIGSMEGLYFESSTTTPFHFLNQDELSLKCSCAQRNLPYARKLDLDLGIKHLQLLGVRYYAASTTEAVTAASAHKDLAQVATTGPWHIYQVADSELVVPLANQPAVVTEDNSGLKWVYGDSDPHGSTKDATGKAIQANGPATTWYQDPTRWDVFLAADGPSEWTRVRRDETPPTRPQQAAKVSAIHTGTDEISFDVDQVGVPVLVKSSYFPNWKVDGAKGPYRVAPNLMVVVPTSTHVRLHYGWTPIDIGGYLLAIVGVALVVLLARRPAVRVPRPERTSDLVLGHLLEAPADEPPVEVLPSNGWGPSG
jgi:hypothetical protein